jgi:hypothetical protein
MRALALLVAVAGCGRFGFGGETADSAIVDGVISDGVIVGDDGATDAVMGDAAPACLASYNLCDGFEGTSFDTTTWTVDSMITLDATRAHRGSKSAHVHTPASAANTSNYQTLNETKTVPGSTTFWLRGWFWLSALPATGNGMELVSAEQSGVGGDYVFVFSDSTHVYTQFGNASQTSPTTVPIGSWFCVIWKVVRSTTTTGALELSGDAPLLSLPNVKTDSATAPMNVITIGMGFASSNTPAAQPALDLWIDDVIVDDAPLTCAD